MSKIKHKTKRRKTNLLISQNIGGWDIKMIKLKIKKFITIFIIYVKFKNLMILQIIQMGCVILHKWTLFWITLQFFVALVAHESLCYANFQALCALHPEAPQMIKKHLKGVNVYNFVQIIVTDHKHLIDKWLLVLLVNS